MLLENLSRLGNQLISLILPSTCPLCHDLIKSGQLLCNSCLNQIKFIQDPLCSICGMSLEPTSPSSHPCFRCLQKKPYFNWHRSVVVYQEPTTHLISKLKYQSALELLKIFAAWIVEKNQNFINQADLLIPVPLTMRRLRKRTFNQSLELAKMISSITQVSVVVHQLHKTKETNPQTKLKRKERLSNLWRAFEWKGQKEFLKNKNIILVDDVYSTGSTLNACARALRPAKPKSIGALTIAGNVKKGTYMDPSGLQG